MKGEWTDEQLDGFREDVVIGRDIDTLKKSKLWEAMVDAWEGNDRLLLDADPADKDALADLAYKVRAGREIREFIEVLLVRAEAARNEIAEEKQND